MRFARLCIGLSAVALFLLSGCANFDREEVYLSHMPEKELYWRAHDQMSASNYKTALKFLSVLQVNYTYGPYFKQAIIDTAYINYLQDNVDIAIAVCNRFLKQFPASEEAPYVMYLKGIIYFYQNENFLARLVHLDVSSHDQQSALKAYFAFQELIDTYPSSIYAHDARQRMVFLIDLLSQSELHISIYYLKKSAYIAAINHAWRLIELYPQSYQTEKALAVLIYGYQQLHFYDLAHKAETTLRLNYPGSVYLQTQKRAALLQAL